MGSFTAAELGEAAEQAGHRLPRARPRPARRGRRLRQARRSSPGPPGTGKTTLAYLAAEVGQRALLCTGFLPTTATTEWTTFETIGGFQPTADGLHLPPRPVRRGHRERAAGS